MEPAFLFSTILLIILLTVSYYVTNGIGSMGAPMRQLALFLMNKAPVGIVDLFKDSPGSGSRTWMKYGTGWFVFTVICGFIGIWHKYDPTALDSLASVGWSYDDGSALADFTSSIMTVSFTYLLVGGCLIAVSRVGNNRLASEANASMVAFIYTASVVFSLILIPIIFRFVDISGEQNIRDLISLTVNYLVSSLIFTAVLMNVLATYSTREKDTFSVSAWFLIMALVAKLVASMYHVIGELTDNTQLVWMADRVLNGWLPLALIFALAYHIIPHATKTPIWSASLLNVNMVLLFITVPPFFVSPAGAGELLQNVGALLMTFALLPIIAGSFNLIATAVKNSAEIAKNPGALAATLAMTILPIYAIGSYFTGMDVFTGTNQMYSMSETVDNGFMFGVGGLMMLSAIFSSYPLAAQKYLYDPSRANLAVWFLMFGSLASTITMLMGDFTNKAILDSGVEEVIASTSGFYLVASALFYLVPIAVIMATLVLIRTGTKSADLVELSSEVTDIDSYVLTEGTTTTIQQLLGRGVGVNTQIIVGSSVEDEGGTTIIAVSASLHNDEVTEFPEEPEIESIDTTEASKLEETDDGDETIEDNSPSQMEMLLDYLTNKNLTVYQFFKSIDLDDSGEIDCFEFQQALVTSDIGDFPPWEIEKLVKDIDLNGDNRINLPELDISLAKLAARHRGTSSESKQPADLDEEPATHSKSSLTKMKKAELIAIAKQRGVSTTGTKSDLISAILE